MFLIERNVTDLAGKPVSAVAALGVASPEPGQADPVALAGYVREQWSIESSHWIRDTLYQEDKSQVRTRSGPRIDDTASLAFPFITVPMAARPSSTAGLIPRLTRACRRPPATERQGSRVKGW